MSFSSSSVEIDAGLTAIIFIASPCIGFNSKFENRRRGFVGPSFTSLSSQRILFCAPSRASVLSSSCRASDPGANGELKGLLGLDLRGLLALVLSDRGVSGREKVPGGGRTHEPVCRTTYRVRGKDRGNLEDGDHHGRPARRIPVTSMAVAVRKSFFVDTTARLGSLVTGSACWA